MLRYLTAGESHGPTLTAIIDGLPAGLNVDANHINAQLYRRQQGYGRGGRMKIESDQVKILSGVRGGYTLGSPVTLQIENKDWANWLEIMTPDPGAQTGQRVVTRPRPGHADLTGAMKYGHRDIRNVLERASARETAARVAVGSVARRLLGEFNIDIWGHVVQIGPVKSKKLIATSFAEARETSSASEVMCADPSSGKAMMEAIDEAKRAGDSLGGVFEIQVRGLPPGLGSYTQWDQRMDGKISGALMSIQAIKGVEIGDGFAAAGKPGSQVHDEIFFNKEEGYHRKTNGAGGLEGGMTNGEILVVRAAMKPIPTLYKPLKSVDIITGEPFEASVERSDVCAVPAACVVGEAVLAWVLAVSMVEMFGGCNMADTKSNYANYINRINRELPR